MIIATLSGSWAALGALLAALGALWAALGASWEPLGGLLGPLGALLEHLLKTCNVQSLFLTILELQKGPKGPKAKAKPLEQSLICGAQSLTWKRQNLTL